MRPALAAALLLTTCAPMPPPAHPLVEAPVPEAPEHPGAPVVLVAMPESPSFRDVRRTMVDELKGQFTVVTSVVSADSRPEDLAAQIARRPPACLVLLDNLAVELYRRVQDSRRPGPPLPPAVVVMASFLQELRAGLRDASGISYEVPGVTTFVNLRALITRPVRRIGVLYRPPFRAFIERERQLAAREEFALVSIELPQLPGAQEVKAALRALAKPGRIDALWILNDNVLLHDDRFVSSIWRPGALALGVPILVGVPGLITSKARFGTFAVIPDHEALGVQAANLVFEVRDRGWHAAQLPIEPPFSTITILNVREARSRFGLREGALERVDRLVE